MRRTILMMTLISMLVLPSGPVPASAPASFTGRYGANRAGAVTGRGDFRV
jgi:hypothetical protein